MISIRHLIWDTENITHVARHNVTPNEIVEVCSGDFLIEQGYSGRLKLIGETKAGRWLAVLLAPKDHETYYPVTARPASRKEQHQYIEVKRRGVK